MVDLSSYKDLYVKTANENIAALKSSLALLSANKLDTASIELAHRSVHTLKTKTELMGDTNVSALAKTMEDILSEVKDGKKTLSDEMIGALVAGAAQLESIFLQVQNTPKNETVTSTPSGTPQSPIKVLVVEDDEFFQKFYSTKLSEKMFTVVVAKDGEEGLMQIEKFKPDLILLDIIMPKKDGFEVLETLSKMPIKPPVIVFSSLGQEQDVARAKSLGAADYINKSFYDFDTLLSKISNVLKK